MDEKVYTIGGKPFRMPPLTLEQKSLIAPFEKEIGSRLNSVNSAATAAVLNEGSTEQLAFSIAGDAEIFWSIQNIAQFFAVILVPDGEAFKAESVKALASHMGKSEVEEFFPVIIDFFLRALYSRSASLSFLAASNAKKSESDMHLKSPTQDSNQG